MVADIAGNGAPKALLNAREIAAPKPPREKTAAEQKLDEVLANLKASTGNTATAVARRQIGQMEIRMEALKLAAGSAAAMGNGRMARGIAEDIRNAARDLTRTLGSSESSGPVPRQLEMKPAAEEKPKKAAQMVADQIRAMLGFGRAGDKGSSVSFTGSISTEDMPGLQSEAGALAGDLKKVLKTLQQTGMNPLLSDDDRQAMNQTILEADAAVSRLKKAATPAAGTLNLKA